MPIDNTLPDHPKLIDFHTGEKPKTEFVNSLDAVNVEILFAPSLEDIKRFVPQFSSGTWCSEPKTEFTEEERDQVLIDLFSGSILPTAYETIKITYRIDGLDLSSVPHLIRHRLQGYSAKGTGDNDCRHDRVLKYPSVYGSVYEERYEKLMIDAKQLYSDMLDDKTIPILDPRNVLPRALEQYYYVTTDLKTLIAFVRQRQDESIEQQEMNVFALKLWLEVCKLYPMIKGMIDFNEPDRFAIKTSIENRSSNFYLPSDKNDVYDYKENWFCRGKRETMRGGEQYIKIKNELLKELEDL